MSRTAAEIPLCNQTYCVYYGGFNIRCTKERDANGEPCPLTLAAQLAALKAAGDALAEAAEEVTRYKPYYGDLAAALSNWRVKAGA